MAFGLRTMLAPAPPGKGSAAVSWALAKALAIHFARVVREPVPQLLGAPLGGANRAALCAVWERFRAQPRTLGPSPGVRDAWHRGRERYAVWLLTVEDSAVAARAARLASRLAEFGSAVPATQHHITVFVAGFPHGLVAPKIGAELDVREPALPVALEDDVEPALLAEQLDSAAAACRSLAPFELWVAGANAFLTAAFLEVHDPSGAIGVLRSALAAPFIRRGKQELRFSPYIPHLTIAHFHDDVATAQVAELLAPCRELEPLRLRPSALELVDFCARTEHAPFRTLARCEFGPL